jgi:hypothetical protein
MPKTTQVNYDHLVGRKASYRHPFAEPRENTIANIKTLYTTLRTPNYVAVMEDGDTIDLNRCYFSEPIS